MLKWTVLKCTPADFGYDTNLWTSAILADLLKQEFDVAVSESTVRLHLKAQDLTCQKPEYQDVKRDEQEIEHFFNDKFPRVQRLASKMGADIGFEDEAGVGVMTRHGRTWGLRGQTPIVKVSMQKRIDFKSEPPPYLVGGSRDIPWFSTGAGFCA